MVERLFLAVPRGCLQFMIVVFPDHTHLLFLVFFLVEMCFEYSGGTSHTDVSLEHTEQAFRWKIMKIVVNIKNRFWVLQWVFR